MEHVHRGTIGTVYSLTRWWSYEFIEAKILDKSDLLNKKIKDSNLSRRHKNRCCSKKR